MEEKEIFMLGAICGDIIGSVYEFQNIKSKDFPLFGQKNRFTDDTVMTIAVFRALKDCVEEFDLLSPEEKAQRKANFKFPKYANLQKFAVFEMQKFGNLYDMAGFGAKFWNWMKTKDPKPYNSWGNGSAMRVSPVAYFAKSAAEVKFLSHEVTTVTHNHEEGLKGAEATAMAVWLALHGKIKEEIKKIIEKDYYSLDFDFEVLKKNYKFDLSCQGTVPQAIFCFLISENFEDAIRNAISIGGDSDTIGAITGSIAEACYGVPKQIETKALSYLDDVLKKEYMEFSKSFKKSKK